MLKRLLSLGAAAIAGLTAACEDGPATVAGAWRSPAAWSSMVYASAEGPLLVEVAGDPFGLGLAVWRAQVAEAMSGRLIGRQLAFTADPEAAPRPNFKVKLAFNAADSLSVEDLCKGRAALETKEAGRITVLAAFCDGDDKALATLRGWVARIEGPDDKRLGQLLGQVVRDLFVRD